MWLIIIVGVAVVILVYGRRIANADPRTVAATLSGVSGAVAIAAGALLSARGGFIIGLPLMLLGAGAVFPGLRRGLQGRAGADGRIEIDTPSVCMRIDRRSGAMDGAVKRGPHAGRRLSQLAETDVRAILGEAAKDDTDGAALLRAYIERRFGAGGRRGGAAPAGAMSEEEALAVLGLEPGASADAVHAAYKRLMVKLHPDQGGTSWLAAKLNAARDRLLGGR